MLLDVEYLIYVVYCFEKHTVVFGICMSKFCNRPILLCNGMSSYVIVSGCVRVNRQMYTYELKNIFL